jgi:hypothetical protein
MDDQAGIAGCGCDPFPTPQGGVCTGCSPNEVLTCEEESILAHMRGIKEGVRHIANKLRNINQQAAQTSEWTELYGQLEALRRQWESWEKKLEDAIEKKLIHLGHREPSA